MEDYFYDDYGEDYDDNYYTDTEIFNPRFENIMEDCIWPSMIQGVSYAARFITTNLVFRVLTQTGESILRN